MDFQNNEDALDDKGACTEFVVKTLLEMFGSTVDREFIETVAWNCKYDVESSVTYLLEFLKETEKNELKHSEVNRDVVEPFQEASTVSVVASSSRAKPVKSKKEQNVDKVISLIKDGLKVLVILRGLPGSGKSRLAKFIIDSISHGQNGEQHIFSADDFFFRNGTYSYDRFKIAEAHEWNKKRAIAALQKSITPVIIDNTNCEIWEMAPYASEASKHDYIIEILEPCTHWAFNVKELHRRNIHNVPRDKIEAMLLRYDRSITAIKLLSALNIPMQGKGHFLNVTPFQRNYKTNNNDTSKDSSTYVKKTPDFLGKHSNILGTKFDVESSNQDNTIFESRNLKPNCYTNEKYLEDNPVSKNENFIVLTESSDNLNDYNTIYKSNDEYSGVDIPTSSNFKTDNNFSKISEQLFELELNKVLSMNADRKYSQENARQTTNNLNQELNALQSGTLSEKSNNLKQSDTTFPVLNPKSWGLSENALISWDDINTHPYDPITFNTPSVHCETKEIGTQTTKLEYENMNSKIIIAKPFVPGNSTFDLLPKLKLTLDKSAMTDESLEPILGTDEKINELKRLFPTLPIEILRDMLEKCQYDTEWAAELLLEDKQILLPAVKKTKQSLPEVDDSFDSYMLCEPPLEQAVDDMENLGKDNDQIETMSGTSLLYNQFSENIAIPSTSLDISRSETKLQTSELEVDLNLSEAFLNENHDLMELNVGDNFIEQLESKFGHSNLSHPKGLLPVIQIPVSFARQLYAFYIESIYQQIEVQNQLIESIIREDEEFAAKLQAQEYTDRNKEECIDLKAIMEDEAGLSRNRRDVEKWRNLTPDDLASKLTRQKLIENFPDIDSSLLVELLQAHNNCYQDTVTTILLSNPEYNVKSIDNIKEPPISKQTVDEMKKAQEKSQEVSTLSLEGKSASEYREEADQFLRLRNDLHQKAQQYHQRGMKDVAIFYSDLAREQTKKYDMANTAAAQRFLVEQKTRINNIETIDLHYLKIKEAVTCLDIFIDEEIIKLKSSSKTLKQLLVITGRGKRSTDGKSRIRPAVMERLERRNISFSLMNPGLLKIELLRSTKLTTDLKSKETC